MYGSTRARSAGPLPKQGWASRLRPLRPRKSRRIPGNPGFCGNSERGHNPCMPRSGIFLHQLRVPRRIGLDDMRRPLPLSPASWRSERASPLSPGCSAAPNADRVDCGVRTAWSADRVRSARSTRSAQSADGTAVPRYAQSRARRDAPDGSPRAPDIVGRSLLPAATCGPTCPSLRCAAARERQQKKDRLMHWRGHPAALECPCHLRRARR